MENQFSKLITRTLQNIQFRLDTTRFIVDKPKFDYQPLPWLQINNAQVREMQQRIGGRLSKVNYQVVKT